MYKRSKLTLGGAPMNKKTSRETHLMNMLNSTGHITTREVVELLDISEATARRMFSELEKSGKIVRKYGMHRTILLSCWKRCIRKKKYASVLMRRLWSMTATRFILTAAPPYSK